MRKLTVLILAGTVVAHLLLLADLPLLIQSVAVLVLTGLIPGFLLMEALVGRSAAPPPLWERLLYGIGAGYGTLVLGMLWMSYLPDGLAAWQVYLAFDGLILLLLVAVGLQYRAKGNNGTRMDADFWIRIGTGSSLDH